MEILRVRECRQPCFQSSVAVLLLHYSPSVEELYHQMRSSLYLCSLLFSLTDTELPHITEITRTPLTTKYFPQCFQPCAVVSFTLSLLSVWIRNHNRWFPVRFRLVSSLHTCRFTSALLPGVFGWNRTAFDLLILSSKKQLFIERRGDFIISAL